MSLLKFLEDIRTPFFDAFFSFFTHFGGEIIFMIIGFFVFWCVNKKKGYYILTVSFFGLLINQFLKITCRVPRPWVKDENFTIVESAREDAVGYSFPSGHTQISVGAYGALAKAFSNRAVRIISIILCVIVPFSRLYLGVHTATDVITSVVIALILIFGLYPLVQKTQAEKGGMRRIFWLMLVLSFGYVVYTMIYPFPADIDAVNLLNAQEYAYKILGIVIGLLIGYEIDEKYIKFETEALWWAQILKLVAGLLIVAFIKEGLRNPLLQILQNVMIADCVRYMLISLFAVGIWPLTFKLFKKQI